MRHWVSMLDSTRAELAELVTLGRRFKAGHATTEARRLAGKILVMVYFNPSLRTRASFEAGMARCGGTSITLNVGGDTWKLEYRDGVVMDSDAAEHIREAAPVLARYGHMLGVRTFAAMKNADEDAREQIIRGFEQYSSVPVINLESAVEHPCQALADWLTIAEKLNDTRGKRFVLSWAPQVKGLPMAVPHSAILAAAGAGMNITIAHPPGYELGERFVEQARTWCREAGSSLEIAHDQKACRQADILYVKSWGSSELYGQTDRQRDSFRQHASWMVDVDRLGPATRLMHCLPVRRNVVISDAALNDERCIVVDQAENRMWAQLAVMATLMQS